MGDNSYIANGLSVHFKSPFIDLFLMILIAEGVI
jgi:uncharacterized protein (DUF1919 family)